MSIGSGDYTPLRLDCPGAALAVTLPASWGMASNRYDLAIAAYANGTMTLIRPGAGGWQWIASNTIGINNPDPATPCTFLVMRATAPGQLYDLTEQGTLDPEALQSTLDALAKQQIDDTPYVSGDGTVTVLGHDESDTASPGSRRPIFLAAWDWVLSQIAAVTAAFQLADSEERAARIAADAGLAADIQDVADDLAAHNTDGAAHPDIRAAITSQVNAEALIREREDLELALALATHKTDYDNPHHVTAEQAGADPANTARDLVAAHNADAAAHDAIAAKVAALQQYDADEHGLRVAAEAEIAADLAEHVNNHSIHLTPGGSAPDGTARALVTFALPTDADGNCLWPEVTISDNPAFSGGVTNVYDGRPAASGGGAHYADMLVFDGGAWVSYPATGAGVGYYGKRVAFTAPNLYPVAGQTYYIRIRVWDGTAWSDYAGLSDVFANATAAGTGDVTVAQMNAAIALAKNEAMVEVAEGAAAIDAKADAAVLAANAAAADAAEALAAVGEGVGGDVAAHNLSGTSHADIRAAITAAAGTAKSGAETTAAGALSAHVAAANPHPLYRLAAAATVSRVNGASGDVSITPAGIAAEPDLGTATAGKVLLSGGAKVRVWGDAPAMSGASAGAAGKVGAVPAAAMGMQNALLHGDATWRKQRHYFVDRLLGGAEKVTIDEKVSFRIPLAGKLVGFGLFVDRVTTTSDWYFYSQLTLNGVNQLATPLRIGREEGLYIAAPELAINCAGPADMWKVVTVVQPVGVSPYHLRESSVYGLSVWFIVEEA